MKTVTNAIVATTPRFLVMADGVTSLCSFRVADNDNDEGFTYWYTVTAINGLAEWVNVNIAKGNRIDVTGKVIERSYFSDTGSQETVYEIVADNIIVDGISGRVSVEDQAEADAIVDATETPKHSCSCPHCYVNA